MRKTTAASLRPIITTALITAGLSLAAAACGSAAAPSGAAAHASPAAHAAASTPAAATTAPPAPLACGVHASRHPVAETLTGVRVRTAPHAWIVATARYASRVQKQGARASALGRHMFSYSAGRGHRVVLDIHVSLHGRIGACQTSFKARQPPPPPPVMPAPMPSPTMMAPTPTPTMM